MNNAGSLRLEGSGSLDVDGTLSMTNGEIIRDADGTAEIFQITAGQINLAAGTRFDVTRGIVSADVVEHGIFAPDTFSPGEVTFDGFLTLTDTAQLEMQLGGTTPGRGFFGYDQIQQITPAGGTLSTVLGGVLKVSLIHDFHKTVTPQNTFSILVSDRMLSGAFNNVASGGRLQTTDGSGSFLVTYAGQNSVVLSQFEVAPLRVKAISRSGANIVINFAGVVSGRSYRLERKLLLTEATWESPLAGANDFRATANGGRSSTPAAGPSRRRSIACACCPEPARRSSHSHRHPPPPTATATSISPTTPICRNASIGSFIRSAATPGGHGAGGSRKIPGGIWPSFSL